MRAELFFKYWTKQRYLLIWQEKYDEKTDIKSLHLMCKARLHHEKIIVKDCFHEWKSFKDQMNVLKVTNIYLTDEFKQEKSLNEPSR